jgi:hypothetical protein
MTCDGSGTVHGWVAEAELLKQQKSGQSPDEPVNCGSILPSNCC